MSERQHGPADGYHRGYAVQAADPARAPRPAHTSVSRRAATLLVATVLGITVVAVLNLVDVAKVIYWPGPVYDTLGEVDGQPVVDVEGLPTYPTSGRLDFTTITLQGGPRSDVSAWQWLLAAVNPRTDVVDEESVFPVDITAEQVQEQNEALMRNSQEGAAVVALRALGEEVTEHVLVAQIIVDAPASGVLEVDDEILAVDGTQVSTPDDVRELLQEHQPGGTVPFRVLREGQERSLDVPTEESEVELPEGGTERRTTIGVYLASDFELPYEVTIDAGNVGGPSAGLMFSLAVYDKVTPGELTGGRAFAGTGTINSVGEVGRITGIRQKMIGAAEDGVEYFLAPVANCPQVRGREPDGLTVAAVGTFEEALEVIEAVSGGEPAEVPGC